MPNAVAVSVVLFDWLSNWAHSLDPIQLLKYFSSLTTAAYGIFATITDFHQKKKNGKQVLSRKGKVGIAFLLLSTIIGFSADGAKDYQSKKDGEKAKAAQKQLLDQETATLQSTKEITSQLRTTNDQLNHTAATTKTILDVSRRAEDQFNTADVTKVLALIAIPTDQEEVYRWRWGGTCGMYKILKENPTSGLGAFLFDTSADISFYTGNEKKHILQMTAKEEDSAHLCEANNSDIMAFEPQKTSTGKVPEMHIYRVVRGATWADTFEGFRTYHDLSNAHVSIVFHYSLGTSAQALHYSVEKLYVSTSRGRYIRADQFSPCSDKDEGFCGSVKVE